MKRTVHYIPFESWRNPDDDPTFPIQHLSSHTLGLGLHNTPKHKAVLKKTKILSGHVH